MAQSKGGRQTSPPDLLTGITADEPEATTRPAARAKRQKTPHPQASPDIVAELQRIATQLDALVKQSAELSAGVKRSASAEADAMAALAAAVGFGEEVEILSAEDLRQGGGGEEESAPRRGQPALAVGAQGAVGDDAVDMDVLAKVLPPGVEHHGDAELAAEPPGIAAELEQGLRGCAEQLSVDEGGIALGDGIELVRQGEHDVPVADVEEVGTLALDPPGLRERLALGAVTIPARCVLNRHRPAVLAARLESAECGGTAAHQRVHDPLLLDREPMRLPAAARVAPDTLSTKRSVRASRPEIGSSKANNAR